MKVVTSRLAGTASDAAPAEASAGTANGIVLMAWGAHAQKMIASLDTVSAATMGNQTSSCCTLQRTMPQSLTVRNDTSFSSLRTRVLSPPAEDSSATVTSLRATRGCRSATEPTGGSTGRAWASRPLRLGRASRVRACQPRGDSRSPPSSVLVTRRGLPSDRRCQHKLLASMTSSWNGQCATPPRMVVECWEE